MDRLKIPQSLAPGFGAGKINLHHGHGACSLF
jgi:hypothetical protein